MVVQRSRLAQLHDKSLWTAGNYCNQMASVLITIILKTNKIWHTLWHSFFLWKVKGTDLWSIKMMNSLLSYGLNHVYSVRGRKGNGYQLHLIHCWRTAPIRKLDSSQKKTKGASYFGHASSVAWSNLVVGLVGWWITFFAIFVLSWANRLKQLVVLPLWLYDA